MELQAFMGFLLLAVTLSCTPGPDWAYAIAAGLRERSFVPAVAGMCSGYVLHTALLAAGIAALMTAIPALLLWLTVAGACYLLWLGIMTTKSWRGAAMPVPAGTVLGPHAELAAAHSPAAPGLSSLGSYLQGFGTSAINPKGMLMFIALTPQFISADASLSVPLQSVVLGLTFVLSTAVIYSLVATGARKLLRSRPGAARGVTLASGVVMCVLGAVLLVEQIVPVTHAASSLLAAI